MNNVRRSQIPTLARNILVQYTSVPCRNPHICPSATGDGDDYLLMPLNAYL